LNLPSRSRFELDAIELAITLIRQGFDNDTLRVLFGPLLEIVSACLRGMIVAGPGHDLIAADFNAIEARAVAWLAEAHNLLDVFRAGQDPYRHQASLIFGVPALGIAQDSRERQVGKAAVLGLGYGMGCHAYQEHCEKEGILLSEKEARRVVDIYRETNPETPALWKALEQAALEAVRHPGKTVPCCAGKINFTRQKSWLFMRLPSGRVLSYPAPRIVSRSADYADQPWGWSVCYKGGDNRSGCWCDQHAFGGRWAEHAASGLCRDLLTEAMLRLEAAGYPIILSVHDEIVAEIPEGFGSEDEFKALMCQLPDWAAGFPVAAKGWRGKRFRK
jgi:DNA polymerase bacteriophage-type